MPSAVATLLLAVAALKQFARMVVEMSGKVGGLLVAVGFGHGRVTREVGKDEGTGVVGAHRCIRT